jgi:predicted regulator of Ras-like GTPase activity (Roadblock/LC7/MglB family)
MFGFLKKFWRQSASSSVPPSPANAASLAQSTPASAYLNSPAAYGRRSLVAGNGHPESGSGVEVSLRGILAGLPLEVQGRVLLPEVGELSIAIPLEKVLAQLSRGSVKISFGELRHAAPGIFSSEADRDRVLVPLPLAEIISRLNPALIACRRVQRKVEVPEDICSPFDARGQGLVFTTSPAKPEPPPPARQVTPTAPTPLAPERRNLSFAPPPAAPTMTPAPTITPSVPRAPMAPAATAPPPIRMPLPPAAPPIRALGALPKPNLPPVAPLPKAPVMNLPAANGNGYGAALQMGAPPTPELPQASPSTPAVAEPEPLVVGLTALAEQWPDGVRKEIVEFNLVDAKLVLPFEAVEQALRLGRISFSWKTLRGWLRPASQPGASPQDGTVLELPLKVVAPLFLARQREATKTQQKVAIDDEIPNLFFGNAPVDPNQAAVARPADTNYYVWSETADVVPERELESHHPSAGTKFITKYATPNEIVSRAAALEGVTGALIALPDGLMVANSLPPDLNGDTLAAFLPQIFGKVSHCTRELRMGELNNLNFTVGNVPWKIFRVNAIFFAAFGKLGLPLPTAQLAALAAELDHKPK